MITRTLVNEGDPIVGPDGEEEAGVTLYFQLVDEKKRDIVSLFDAAEDGGEYIIGHSIPATTNEFGLFTVALWPNSRGEIATCYKVTIPGRLIKPFYIRVTEGDGNLTLLAAKVAMEAIAPQTLSLFDALLARLIGIVDSISAVATTVSNGLMSSVDKVRLDTLWGATVTIVSTNGAIANYNGNILADTATGAVTRTLPTATGNMGVWLYLENTGTTSNLFTLTPAGVETIEGAASLDLDCGMGRTIYSDGASWRVKKG